MFASMLSVPTLAHSDKVDENNSKETIEYKYQKGVYESINELEQRGVLFLSPSISTLRLNGIVTSREQMQPYFRSIDQTIRDIRDDRILTDKEIQLATSNLLLIKKNIKDIPKIIIKKGAIDSSIAVLIIVV